MFYFHFKLVFIYLTLYNSFISDIRKTSKVSLHVVFLKNHSLSHSPYSADEWLMISPSEEKKITGSEKKRSKPRIIIND